MAVRKYLLHGRKDSSKMDPVYGYIFRHDSDANTRWTYLMGLDEKCYVAQEEHLLELGPGTVVAIGMLLPSGEVKEVVAVENAPNVSGHGQLWTWLASTVLVKIPLPPRSP